MRIVLDNCVHYRAKSLFPSGHEVLHARDLGWRSLSNRQLIAKAAHQFEVLATTDKNIRYEHNLALLSVSVLELNSKFTRLQDLRTLQPFLAAALEATRSHRFVSVNPDGTLEKLAERT